ncbi:hypothetical protein B0919_09930 [Hymenobacter sp. CRA2]|nr:hypothetical protein B0919_09930 [Hymenobacter sp. CRA2]
MSILRYETLPHCRQKAASADEALLALLLTAGAGILFLTSWLLLPPLLGLVTDFEASALTGASLTLTGSAAAVGWWVLRRCGRGATKVRPACGA